jgi:hypothetical protein
MTDRQKMNKQGKAQAAHYCTGERPLLPLQSGFFRGMPGITTLFRLGEKLLNFRGISVGKRSSEFRQILHEYPKDTREMVSIGHRDIPPQGGGSGGNPTHIPESARAESRLFRGVDRTQDIVCQGGRYNMRQMAGSAYKVIMLARREPKGARPESGPKILDEGHCVRIASGSGGYDANRILEQILTSGSRARFFRTGHRVTSDEPDSGIHREGFQFINYRPFNTANIGDDHVRFQPGQHVDHQLAHLTQRGAEHYEVRVFDRFGQAARGGIDHPECEALFNSGGAANEAGYMAGKSPGPGSQANGSPEQPDTHNR